MLLRQRQQSVTARSGNSPDAGAASSGNLEQLRESGQRYLHAIEEAIQRGLEGDALSLLHATRQEGGQ